jgi:hypothetical protein
MRARVRRKILDCGGSLRFSSFLPTPARTATVKTLSTPDNHFKITTPRCSCLNFTWQTASLEPAIDESPCPPTAL